MNNDSNSTPGSPLITDFGSRLVPLCDGRSGLRGALRAEISQPSGSEPIIDFVASSEALDRYDEIISADGWRLDNYRRNPVFQNAHQYGDIVFTLGRALITEIRHGVSTPGSPSSTYLYQRIEFATEINPLARIAYGLYKGRFLNAVSVGFIPLRWENADGTIHSCSVSASQSLSLAPSDGERSHPGAESKQQAGESLPSCDNRLSSIANCKSQIKNPPPFRRRYLEQELLEVSAVGIPANPEALQLALKSGAIAKSDLQSLLDLLRQLTSTPNPSGLHPSSDVGSRISDFRFWAASGSIARVSGTGSNETQLLRLARELRQLLSRA
jgi:hypothetical protein